MKYGIGEEDTQPEGRIITMEFADFFLINVYTPNSQRDLARLDVRLEWEDALFQHIMEHDKIKPVILCGDLNVAHQEIDIRNYKTNYGNSGFTDEEREKMTRFLNAGFIDTLRHFYPDEEGIYTWWSYMKTVRERNIGWRIDYFIVSERLKDNLIDSNAHSAILGSDHCPIILKSKSNSK